MSGRTIALDNVEHFFAAHRPNEPHIRALRPTTVKIEAQQFVALVGPSGCGKTTVLNMVAGLIRPHRGSITLDGKVPRVGDPDVGYLLARDALLPWRTTLRNATLPLEVRGIARAEREKRARKLLAEVGLEHAVDGFPVQLSHGMRQRVAVARTLIAEPHTLLMDEPFSALDALTRLSLQQMFLRLWEQLHSTVLFVTHDLTEAILMADRVLVFSPKPGCILAEFPIEFKRPRSLVDLQGSDEFHRMFREIWNVFHQQVAL